MAKNYIKPGEHQTFTASADVSSGAGILLGTLFAVALTNVAQDAQGEAGLVGVWELPKNSAAVIAAWSKPTWDVSAGEFVAAGSEATGDLIGGVVAVEAAGSGSTTVKVMLLPGAGSLKAE